MNFANLHRQVWCSATVAKAVRLFHKHRLPGDSLEQLGELAKEAADVAFQARIASVPIVGSKELTAKMYLDMSLERFKEELITATRGQEDVN